jgi:endonuclease/exonuclease/phosphatase (EEP) superfamily protein YafD
LWFLYKCFAFYTLVVYALILWIPSDGWLACFMMMSFPVLIVVHFLSVPIWFLVERKKAILPIVLLLLGGIFLPRTFKFGNTAESQSASDKESFSVISYNTHVFMKNSDQSRPGFQKSIAGVKRWLSETDADVLCMPEYFEDETPTFNFNKVLSDAGYKYNAKYRSKVNQGFNYYWGLVVYSKHPIVASRDTVFESQNGMIQTDIRINGDTVRVIGLHLYSMMLNLGRLTEQKEMKGIKREGKFTFNRMKTGFIQRSRELEILESWVTSSPYPVIVCGDFNEVPYGYVYGSVRKTMSNSFEEGGKGFGFTFNSMPYFIRIDHQFYSPGKLSLVDFETFNKVKYSDHFPIKGTYRLSNNPPAELGE